MPNSLAQQAEVICSNCSQTFTVDIWLIIDTNERPDLLDRIQAGTLHDTLCPHCDYEGQADVPLLLYRPGKTPTLIFSPAEETTEEEDVEQYNGLVYELSEQLGTVWRDEWSAEGLKSTPRTILPTIIHDDPKAIWGRTQEALDELRQYDPEEYQRLIKVVKEEVMSSNPLLSTLYKFIQTDTWIASYLFMQTHPELLSEEAETLLASFTDTVQQVSGNKAKSILEERLTLLRRSRETYATTTFVEKMDISPEVPTRDEFKQPPSIIHEILSELAQSGADINSFEDMVQILAARPDLQAKLAVARGIRSVVPPQFQNDLRQATVCQQDYLQYRDRAKLDEAIAAWERIFTHPDFPVAPDYFQLAASNDGGITFLNRYEAQGELKDLNRALEILQETAWRISSDSPNLPSLLNTLGVGLRARHERTGQLTDLKEAIRVHQTAIQRTSSDSPNLPSFLNNLGIDLQARYRRTGQLADLEEAISYWRKSIHHAPPNSPDLPNYLNNLGSGLRYHYDRTGQLEDLEEGIHTLKEAIQYTPFDSPNLPSLLSNLGAGLRICYEHTNQLADLEEAIQAHQTAVVRVPPNSPNLPGYLHNLGSALHDRYKRIGQLADLEEAIRTLKEAIPHIPPDSPDLPGYLNSLGTRLRDRWRRTDAEKEQKIRDQKEGIVAYEQACRLGQEQQTSVTLLASRNWCRWALERHAWAEAEEACQYGLNALERLYRTQLLRQSRRSWQKAAKNLVVMAAYAQARIGQVTQAVLTLEQGRTRQLNERLARDQAKLDDLAKQQPQLRDRYWQLTDQLRQLETVERQQTFSNIQTTDWTQHRQQIQTAIDQLDTLIEQIRQVSGYETFLSPASWETLLAAIQSNITILYLLTTEVGSLGLLLQIGPDNQGAITPIWLNNFNEDDLNSFLVKRSEDTVVGGYLYGQLGQWRWLRAALREGLPQLGENVLVPIAEHLHQQTIKQLVIIPTGRLNLLPIHAASYILKGQQEIFGDTVCITYAPSAQSVAQSHWQLANRPTTPPRLLSVGDPQPVTANPLVFSHHEASEIMHYFPERGELFLTTDATLTAIWPRLAQADYIHLSCHGLFDPENPLQSGLLFSHDERLTLAKLLDETNLTKVRLAILSACQTAINDFNDLPDEVIGLPAGFLQAGVPGVIGTLWPVNDHSTSLLMVRFYHYHMDGGLPPAAALQKAQHWLRNATRQEIGDYYYNYITDSEGRRLGISATDAFKLHGSIVEDGEPDECPFAHPYYWAGFAFYGN